MLSDIPLGPAIYELSGISSADTPFVLSSSSPVSEEFWDSLIDIYVGLFDRLVQEYSGTLGTPVFDDGKAATGYPAGFDYDFVTLWHHAGREKFLGLLLVEAEYRCVIELGVKS